MLFGPGDAADQVILEVSVIYEDTVWSPWQALIGESQWMLLGSWTKALLLSSDNCFPLERALGQLLGLHAK